jgi:hypothetical protein
MTDYRTFQEFMNEEDAVEMAAKLKQQGINAVIEKSPDLLGQELIGRQYNSFILLKIPKDKFIQAQQALISSTNIDMDSVDRNYMLFSLSDEELMDVITKPDEWGAYNYNLARLILKERGINVNEQHVDTLKNEHINKLSQQRSLDPFWLFLGYFFSIISIIAVLVNPALLVAIYSISLLPGILGIIMGAIVIRTKRTLPDGSRIKSYDAKTRRHGLFMIVIGVFAFVFAIVVVFSRAK